MINIKQFLCRHKYDYIICEDYIANIENDNDDLEDVPYYMAIVYCPKWYPKSMKNIETGSCFYPRKRS